MLLSYEKNMTLAPSKLSEKIGSKKSTRTGVLKGLEKNGLVKRVALSNDKRTNYVQLTDLGLMKLKEFLPYNYEVVSKVFGVFNEEEKAHSITAIWNFEKQNYYLKDLKR
ncbi:transcriptional regulator YetL, MarR family [Mammaliicoccus fleurettii]|nr:transcriptional regulator YetL, MarR family [Mammaliicoccus fleurettii]